FGIHVEHLQRVAGDSGADLSIGAYLGEIANPAQQAVGDAGRAARTPGDFAGTLAVAIDADDAGRTTHDAGQLGRRIELQALDDTEAIAQGCGQQPGAGGRADQGERRQVELDRARRRTFADHDVDLEVF